MSTEVEKLRGLLRECADQLDLLIEIYNEDDFEPEDIAISEQIRADVKAALSQQAEPVEPAPAQDEWEFDSRCLDPLLRQYCHNDGSTGFVFAYEAKGTEQLVDRLRAELATRPAQTAPQPEQSVLGDYVLMPKKCPSWLEDVYDACCDEELGEGALYLPAYEAMAAALARPAKPTRCLCDGHGYREE